MEMRNNVNFTGFNPNTTKTALNDLNKEVKVAVKKFNTAPTDNSLQELKSTLGELKNKTTQIKTDIIEASPKEEKSGYIEWLGKKIKKITDNDKFEKYAKNVNTLPYLIVVGNACKEAVGTAIYTVQALTNEDLPADKRKFVGMYDLAVGIISTTLSLVLGVTMVKKQAPLIKKLIGGKEAAELPGYAKAFAGIAFIIPTVLQNILIKRIVAPSVATPLAGDLKKRLEEKESNNNKPTDSSIPINNDIALSAKTFNDIDKIRDDENTNLFDIYKKAEGSK